MQRAGATLHRGARASHYRGLSCCGAQAPDPQAQQLWLTGPVAPRHVGSSQTRARTRVPCIGRQTPNHCATREALIYFLTNQSTQKHCLPAWCSPQEDAEHVEGMLLVPKELLIREMRLAYFKLLVLSSVEETEGLREWRNQ